MAVYEVTGLDSVNLGIVVGSVIVDHNMGLVNSFAMNPQNVELTFAGNSQAHYVTLNLGLRGGINSHQWDTTMMEAIIGITAVTASIPVDETKRWYTEGGTYPPARARVVVNAIDKTTGAANSAVKLRFEIFHLDIYPRPWLPPNLPTAAVTPFDLSWTATKETTDLLAVALPGVPAAGAYFSVALLT